MMFAPAGWFTLPPTAVMRSPSTRISPGLTMRPVSTSNSRAACRTVADAGRCDAEDPCASAEEKEIASPNSAKQQIFMFESPGRR